MHADGVVLLATEHTAESRNRCFIICFVLSFFLPLLFHCSCDVRNTNIILSVFV